MKEYKARRFTDGTWVSGHVETDDFGYPQSIKSTDKVEHGIKVTYYNIDTTTLCEPIEQLDNQGKGIYVGDICEYGSEQFRYSGEVKFFVDEGCYAIDDPQGKINKYKRITKNTIKKDNIIIVGNIYDTI